MGKEKKIEENKQNEFIDPNDIKPRKWLLVVLIIIGISFIIIHKNKNLKK